MKNLFKINTFVQVENSGELLIVKDLEVIDGQFIYYFDNFKCFPEKMLKLPFEDNIRKILSIPQEKRESSIKEVMSNFLEESLKFLKN